VGSAVPTKVVSNADLEKIMDTSDEWIRKRTGIVERRVVDQESEGTYTLSVEAVRKALDNAGVSPSDLDLVILASVTAEMTCPSNACRVAAEIGAVPTGAFDLVAACSGFVYAMNVADSLIRSGRHRTIAVIGCDAMSTAVDYTERSVSILFGDAAGSAILTRDDEDPTTGCLFQTLRADGSNWESLYMPRRRQEVAAADADNPIRLGHLRMNGREIYKFAVKKFGEVIEEALDATGLTVDDIKKFVVHQSNIRIIDAARERLGMTDDKVYVNIDRFGNSSAGSAGLCLDQLWQSGEIGRGDTIMLVAFGGGLTWASSVWKI
jgi:3-oxoacyl-[acyl-carrier-protein] synthase-3